MLSENLSSFKEAVFCAIPKEDVVKIERRRTLKFLEKIVFEIAQSPIIKKKSLKIVILRKDQYIMNHVLVYYIQDQGVVFECYEFSRCLARYVTAEVALDAIEASEWGYNCLKNFLDDALKGKMELKWI